MSRTYKGTLKWDSDVSTLLECVRYWDTSLTEKKERSSPPDQIERISKDLMVVQDHLLYTDETFGNVYPTLESLELNDTV